MKTIGERAAEKIGDILSDSPWDSNVSYRVAALIDLEVAPLVDALTKVVELTERHDACETIEQIAVDDACGIARQALAQSEKPATKDL